MLLTTNQVVDQRHTLRSTGFDSVERFSSVSGSFILNYCIVLNHIWHDPWFYRSTTISGWLLLSSICNLGNWQHYIAFLRWRVHYVINNISGICHCPGLAIRTRQFQLVAHWQGPLYFWVLHLHGLDPVNDGNLIWRFYFVRKDYIRRASGSNAHTFNFNFNSSCLVTLIPCRVKPRWVSPTEQPLITHGQSSLVDFQKPATADVESGFESKWTYSIWIFAKIRQVESLAQVKNQLLIILTLY